MKRIAIICIFGAISLQGCGENRNKEVSTGTMYEVKTETLTSTPMNNPDQSAAVVPATTPVRKQARYKAKPKIHRQAVVRNDEISTGQAAPVIQAQDEQVTFPQDKTYNELQISDDVNDYPLSPEAIRLEKQTYM